ncbi:GNAT family N-acetyltransferase [Endozoicomonas sp. SM1973]|uniref:GNAT family N-acetyltransferase n=1 Tax=Spartinivicinus marinus TaxID=2994442 RepID=A0A853I5V8_9GAMM|nr:GNAT family N-acetyltransferase [Spartinivicinus marinus]MCX4027230.1 GNAT family N-acetyltransferase [Spartinivicinus marinus]NYZ66048.1 GNAT family N-acetyltransferase [Spartinivicinus marinus]
MEIKVDDLNGSEVTALLLEHLQHMFEYSPPESVHALNLDGLRQTDVTFWSIWEGNELAGCGALKELDCGHGEIKSMRTASSHLRKGVGATMLQHLIDEARRRNYQQLSLETGSMDYFKPAHQLYYKFGFTLCGPFANYTDDPNSLFMMMKL